MHGMLTQEAKDFVNAITAQIAGGASGMVRMFGSITEMGLSGAGNTLALAGRGISGVASVANAGGRSLRKSLSRALGRGESSPRDDNSSQPSTNSSPRRKPLSLDELPGALEACTSPRPSKDPKRVRL